MFKLEYRAPTDVSQITAFLNSTHKEILRRNAYGEEINRILLKKQSIISVRSSDDSLWSITFKENIPKSKITANTCSSASHGLQEFLFLLSSQYLWPLSSSACRQIKLFSKSNNLVTSFWSLLLYTPVFETAWHFPLPTRFLLLHCRPKWIILKRCIHFVFCQENISSDCSCKSDLAKLNQLARPFFRVVFF